MTKQIATCLIMLLVININSYCQYIDSINQPKIIVQNGVEFEVIRGKMSFTVDKTGKLKDAKVYELNCKECSKSKLEEYKEQIKQSVIYSPAWVPGTDSLGKIIAVDYDIPVKLKIEKKKAKKQKKKKNK